jgi:hypothetical protein
MLQLVIVAATLWLCPGEVYTNEQGEGCRPVQSSGKEGFSRVPEAPPDSIPMESSTTTPSPQERRSGSQTASPQMCALYKEYVELELKTQGGFLNTSTEQVDRWQTLRRMFQGTPPPVCP